MIGRDLPVTADRTIDATGRRVRAVEFVRTEDVPDGFRDTAETFRLPADQVVLGAPARRRNPSRARSFRGDNRN